MAFGAWETKAKGITYIASTDGFVVAYGLAFGSGDNAAVFGYTDGNVNPTTLVAKFNSNSGDWDSSTMTFPVKRGDSWKVITTSPVTVKWMPIVSGGSSGYNFGGLYGKNEAGTCVYTNPFTDDCTCPPGYTSKQMLSAAQYAKPAAELFMCYKI